MKFSTGPRRGEETTTNHIEEHSVLEGLQLEQNKIKDEQGSISLKDSRGEAIDPLVVNFISPDDINNQYKAGLIKAEDIPEKLKKIESGRKEVEDVINNLGMQWINGIYISIHGGHHINMLALQGVGLDKNKEYYTSTKLSLNSSLINYLGDFGDKSIFISPSTSFGNISMGGFSQGISVIAIDNSTGEILTSDIVGGDIISEEEFNLYKHEGNLLLVTAKKSFLYGQKNSLKVLVNADGTLGYNLFKGGEINISETEDGLRRNQKKVSNILEME